MKKKHSTKKIHDEFTDLPLSRQRKYQLRQHKVGNCIKCGRPRCSAMYCLDHMIAAREYLRKRTGAVGRLSSLSYRLEKQLGAAKKRRPKVAKQGSE